MTDRSVDPESPPTDARTRRTSALVRLGIFILVLASAWLAARQFGLLEYLETARLGDAIRQARALPWAAPAFVAVYAIVASLGLPGTPLTLAGGAIFGVAWGTGLNWLGATLGATGAFFLARMLGGDAVRALLGKRAGALDRIAGDGAFATLIRLRLIPVVPFNALNFGAGLAGVRPWTYVVTTALGIIPGTAVYTYFADSLIAGVDGAREAAFMRVAIAGALLVALSFVPALARRLGWIAAAAFLATASTPAGVRASDSGSYDSRSFERTRSPARAFVNTGSSSLPAGSSATRVGGEGEVEDGGKAGAASAEGAMASRTFPQRRNAAPAAISENAATKVSL